MTILHSALYDANSHKPGYIQSGDPGAVGAGIVWVDTSGGTGAWVLKVRNAADTGWETVSGGGGGATIRPRDPQVRLSLTTGDPADVDEVTGATTLYCIPFKGNIVTLYDGSSDWEEFELSSQISASLSGLTADLPYDVFVYDSSGLTLDLTAWSDANTRATALTTQDGKEVKTGATSRLYLGTILINSSGGQCDKSFTLMGIWNRYNQLYWPMRVIDTTNSWTYGSTTVRAANNSNANRVTFVQGLDENPIDAQVTVQDLSTVGGYYPSVGIGIDRTNGNDAVLWSSNHTVNINGISHAILTPTFVGIGAHYLQWVEWNTAAYSLTYYGDNGGLVQSGLVSGIWS